MAAAKTQRSKLKELAGDRRIEIERLLPAVDGGRYPIKRIVGDTVDVEAHIFTDGHDSISGRVLWRKLGARRWDEAPLRLRWNDEWLASFQVTAVGEYEYTVEAWVDHYLGWATDLEKRIAGGQELTVELRIGADLLRDAAGRATKPDARRLLAAAEALDGGKRQAAAIADALRRSTIALATRYPEERHRARLEPPLRVVVDRERAGFSAWYEMFPRSTAEEPEQHGTFADVERRLPYLADMGIDVLYLPPIHPIGEKKRKGPNNQQQSEPGDVGSPWAIGSSAGGHKSVHPDLGTLEDFRRLVTRARQVGIEVALDIAFQCSPDHPYVREHPEWFKFRPDGSVQYAENPPKKYEDIYPFNFESEAWPSLWLELKSIFEHWVDQGVEIFRVDNPHTKPFAFWEWCIGEIRREHPGVIFLAEAFTRPKIMYRLAKLGFSQSYTYFAWRTAKWELEQYLEELAQTGVQDFFRPNFWPNTPDILTEYLQTGARPAFMVRLLLAATLSPNYGIYGPPFELLEHVPREPGSEEYVDSEKYEVRTWDLERPESLAPFIGHVNRIRRELPALQRNDGLHFHNVDNEQILAFSKLGRNGGHPVLVVVNLDPHNVQSGWLSIDEQALGQDGAVEMQVRDHLVRTTFRWSPGAQFVRLDPAGAPAHIFELIPVDGQAGG